MEKSKIHYMKLHNSPFLSIKNKTKTIEMRLNDEKRSSIKKGDYIVFTNCENDEKIKTQVVNLYKYTNFEELYKAHDKQKIGYTTNEIANPCDMLKYYSQEQIEKYQVLAIEISLVD